MNSINIQEAVERQMAAEKEAAYMETKKSAGGILAGVNATQAACGYANQADASPSRSGILERVSRQVNELAASSRKIDNLMELRGLLERNPEVARILDLLDANILRG